MKRLLILVCVAIIHIPVVADMQQQFWDTLVSLKGQSFEGRLVNGTEPTDKEFMKGKAVMYIWKASDTEIRIPFHIGNDHSRTWVLRKTATGIQLKHDHRKPDGSDDPITQYGGDTFAKGTPIRQEFAADEFTGQLLAASAKNIWAMEIEPGLRFIYELRREHEDRFFRVEFDMTRTVPTPPPAWGDEGK